MKKELSPSLEMVACDVCGRTILKGERTEPYLVPDGSRRLVCDLCVRRAEGAGWLREALHGDLPAATPRAEPRRSLLGRLRRRIEDDPLSSAAGDPGEPYAGERWPPEPSGRDYDDLSEPEPAYEAADGAVDGEPGTDYGREPGDGPDPERGDGPDREPATPDPHEPEAPGAAPYSGVAPAAEPASFDEPDPVPEAFPEEAATAADQVVGGPPPSTGAPEPARGREDGPGDPLPPLDEFPPEDPPLEGSLIHEPAAEEFASGEEPAAETRAERRERRYRRRLRDPRHVRAVPTGADAKVERALEIFNLSDYRRTVGGLVRTLGEPWVTARPHPDSASEVTVVVAWELSWYQFRVDLGDSDEPVAVADKGHEVEEIDEELRRWNARATDDGALETGTPSA